VRLAPTLVAALACALAIAAGTSSAGVAPAGAVGALAVSPHGGRVLVGIDGARPGSWLFASDDGGATWQKARGVAGAAGVTALAFAPSNPAVAYAAVIVRRAGHLGSGFYASGDAGSNWRATTWKSTVGIFHRSLPAAVDTIVIDPQRPRTVYAITHGVLRRSLDGGASWVVARAALPPTLDITSDRTQQLAAGRAGTLYYATGLPAGPGQVYRSLDHGDSWQPAGRGLPAVVPGWGLLALASDATRAGVVYAATGRGLYATVDSGRSWTRALADPSTAVASARSAGGPVVVIASQARGLLERVGAAGLWKGLREPPGGLSSFVLDPADAARIYGAAYTENDPALSACATLWASGDAGAMWTSAGGSLPLVRKHCSR
jgi:photosystem II stability/assembly factor-like uncharacterized protein